RTGQRETGGGSSRHTARDPRESPRVQRAHLGHEAGASFSLHGRIYASDVGDRRQGGSAVGPAPKGEISAPSERSRTSLPQRVLPQRIRSPWAPGGARSKSRDRRPGLRAGQPRAGQPRAAGARSSARPWAPPGTTRPARPPRPARAPRRNVVGSPP